MMKKLNVRRALALLLAAAAVLASPQTPVLLDAAAAGIYGIKFYDATTEAEEQNTSIVEGSSINIRATLPVGYDFSRVPFSVRETGGASAATKFDITKNGIGKNYYTLIAKATTSGPNPNDPTASKEYVLDAIYTALLSSASGTAIGRAGTEPDPDNPGGTIVIPAVSLVLDVVADPAVAITEDSTLSFTALENESTASTDGNSTLLVSTTTATGGFATAYNNVDLGMLGIKKDATGRYFTLNISSRDPANPTPLQAKVYIQGQTAGQKIPKDTVFTINFIRQTLNSMILTVVSPKKLVNDAASSIRENPTDPLAPGTGKPYIQLATGETLQSIVSSFTMYAKIHRLNVDVNIDWEWVATNPAHQGNVQIKDKTGSGTTLKTFEIINRPKEDMPGRLKGTVRYNGYTSDVIDLPVTVFGTGVPPNIIPMDKWTGNPGADSGGNPRVERITRLPTTLDVYRGDADPGTYDARPLGPYKFTFSVDYGQSRGRAENLKVKYLGDGGEVEMRVDGTPVPYIWEADLKNEGANRSFEITATKLGQVRLQFQFYDAKGDPMTADWITWGAAYVNDSRPKTDGRLELLNLRGFSGDSTADGQLKELYPDRVIDYGFNRDTNEYPSITVPNKVDSITLQPRILAGMDASRVVEVEVLGGATEDVTSNNQTRKIDLEVQIPKTIRVTVKAQDGSKNIYTLKVTRRLPDSDSTLKDLQVKLTTPVDAPNLVEGFDKNNVGPYKIDVPYNVDRVKVEAEPNSVWAKADIEPKPITRGVLFWKSEEYVEIKGTYDPETNTMKDNVTTITVTVTAEEGSTKKYTVLVTRLAPDDERGLESLAVLDENGEPITFLKNGKETEFDSATKNYVVEIPYSTKRVSIQAQPKSEKAINAMLQYPPVYSGGKTDTKPYIDIGAAIEWRNIDVSQKDKPDEALNLFTFEVAVTAESQRTTDPPYTIEFTRVPPETDNSLSNLVLEDQDNKVVTENYSFNPEQLEYEFSVPYLTKSLKVTPTTASKVATVTVNGVKMTETKNYATVQLDTSKVAVITVVVTAEDGTTRTYTLRVTRSKASTEARLSNLQVGALTLKPKFVPAKTSYSVTIPEGTKGFTVTATTVDPYATLTIDGKAAASGVASETITPVEVITKVEVVVTAQDGKTTKTYVITVTDDNMVEKNSNADLKSLTVSPSDLNPKFRPGDLEYEAYVKSDTYSVEIVPVTSDRHATVTVYMGGKKIGDYYGNYSGSLIEDENDFRIEVVSSDKTVTNNYEITVYRNDEEKQGNLQPITAEMVNFAEESPIVVDISKYHIVAADVFNTLKTDYPDKTIIFEGNDYSLEVTGKDLKRLVPNTEQFDFAISFTTPQEDAIWDIINERNRNEDLEPVFVYFSHHGELPAPMKFTLSLGREYRNARMYWNYYNEERERIDYYGDMTTNAKGTFAVTLTHMSTYITAKDRIYGAEDRTNMNTGGTTVGNYNIELTNGKDNPNTGEDNG